MLVDPQNRRHVWQCDPARGGAPVVYEVQVGDDRFVNIRMRVVEFTRAGDLTVPARVIHETWIPEANSPRLTEHGVMEVRRVAVNDPQNTPEAYPIVWPEGAEVLDARSGMTFRIKNGEKKLPDERIFDAMVGALDRVPPSDVPATAGRGSPDAARAERSAPEQVGSYPAYRYIVGILIAAALGGAIVRRRFRRGMRHALLNGQPPLPPPAPPPTA